VTAALNWLAPPSKTSNTDATDRKDSAAARIAKRLELQQAAGAKRPAPEQDNRPTRKIRCGVDAPVCVFTEAKQILKRAREETCDAIVGPQSQDAACSSGEVTCGSSDAKRIARSAAVTNESPTHFSKFVNTCYFADCDSNQPSSCDEWASCQADLTDDEMQAAGERGQGIGQEEKPPSHPYAPQRPSLPHMSL